MEVEKEVLGICDEVTEAVGGVEVGLCVEVGGKEGAFDGDCIFNRVVEAHSGGDGDGLAIPGSIEVSFTGCAEVGGIGSIEHFSRDTAMVEDYEVILEGEEGAFKESGGEVLLSKGARELHVK
ncbi:hypothetical protein CYMTET_30526 [Cymbomonas tetramitiformis]|uniref:Uncharacterized protein n=1 Tax=Cymbomonas tetramitiformis TaxID=36881 RepID=A0AAE0FIN8_9CHLO|nr:hypothetical protein CYMTET_30526 [Cymbomonas tetramitiformis]